MKPQHDSCPAFAPCDTLHGVHRSGVYATKWPVPLTAEGVSSAQMVEAALRLQGGRLGENESMVPSQEHAPSDQAHLSGFSVEDGLQRCIDEQISIVNMLRVGG